MATRPEVEDAIIEINDNGNNTAVEVRDVLTKLLDYTENEPQQPSILVPFHFFKPDPIPDMQNSGNFLWYSSKGIIDLSVNFTFALKIDNPSNEFLFFKINPDHYQILRKITQHLQSLNFVVPVFSPINEVFNTLVMSISLMEINHIGIKLNTRGEVTKGDSIYTSIHFHSPEFNFEGFKSTILTKKEKVLFDRKLKEEVLKSTSKKKKPKTVIKRKAAVRKKKK
jgi:hypothetical protein